MKNLEKKINQIINLYNSKKKKNFRYSLLDDALSDEDIFKGIEVLLKKKITMGRITERFEYEFAKYLDVKYALMVNSGSSANLLAAFALVNPKKKNFLKPGDEFLIQALCWSTSLWPLVQAGLKPKFIDVNKDTLNVDENFFLKSLSKKTKAAMIVHVLGNSSNITKIANHLKKKKIFLIEDTCESLGTKYNSKYLGTFGDFGTYSFYYSHQITSGEGGMIVCNNRKDYEIINSLRAHGWDRGINKSSQNQRLFNFINSGFNLRPLDITAAIGMNQFKRLNLFKRIRNENRKKIIDALNEARSWKKQLTFVNTSNKLEPSWFGLPMLIDKKYAHKKKRYLEMLNKNKIETRPIISGNFMNQKSVRLYNLNPKKIKYPEAQDIEDRGFFIGLHTKPISKYELKNLIKKLLLIEII